MTRRTEVLSINKKEDVHFFVSSFLFNQNINVKISRVEILHGINFYIKENKDILRIENDSKSFKIINKLKIFFDNCSMIAKMRGETIIIPKVMRYTEIMKYIKYCIVKNTDIYIPSDTDIYIPSEEDLEYQKYFINTISDELYSIVFSPDRISSWIHLTDVDLTRFNDSSKFI